MDKKWVGFGRYFVFYIFSPLLFRAVYPLIDGVHQLLSDILPSVFYAFNQVTEKDAYEAQQLIIRLIAGALTLLLINLISVVYDNFKNEYIIGKTDGFYTIAEGLRLYASRFTASDFAATVSVPLIFALPSLIPRNLSELLDTETSYLGSRLEALLSGFFTSTTVFTDVLGAALGIFLIVLLSVLFHGAAAIIGLKRWRGLWLSDIERI